MKNIPAITKDELLWAIRGGVYDAVWQVATNATGAPCGDFYHAIQEGVKEAMDNVSVEVNCEKH